MPPWHARLHLGSPSSKPSATAKSVDSKNPPQDQLFNNTPLPHPPLHGVPVVPLQSTSPGSAPRLHHSRSRSHPFPSLSSVKKQWDGAFGADGYDGYLDEAEIENGLLPGLSHKEKVSSHSHPCGLPNSDRNFLTGNCSTCNSSVRWPKGLWVFRCTVCLMVNDLKPTAKPTGTFPYGDIRDSAVDTTTSATSSTSCKSKRFP